MLGSKVKIVPKYPRQCISGCEQSGLAELYLTAECCQLISLLAMVMQHIIESTKMPNIGVVAQKQQKNSPMKKNVMDTLTLNFPAGTAVHPNPKAPRCLPCGHQDPLQGQVPNGSFDAPMVS